jgi:hypothetical protein
MGAMPGWVRTGSARLRIIIKCGGCRAGARGILPRQAVEMPLLSL